MKREQLLDKISDLKEKFVSFFQHRKKIKALENFSGCEKFIHNNYLFLIKECMKDGFLGEDETKFLDSMLNRYEVNYLDWSHKTKWLKEKMAQMKPAKPTPTQQFFNFDNKDLPIAIPIQILSAQSIQKGIRI